MRKVLVHTPGPEVFRPLGELGHEIRTRLGVAWRPGAPDEHLGFVRALREHQAEVLEFVDVLDEAILHCSRAGQLRPWLEASYPSLLGRNEPVTASLLIGRRGSGEAPEDRPDDSLPPPLKCLVFLRDDAVMTPRGLVLTNFLNRDRALEMDLVRLAFRWSPRLRDYPVVFDARREGVYLQGGDLMVLDDRTLLLGVGNLTAPAAARRLARGLGLDVVAVTLPGDGRFRHDVDPARWNPLRTLSLHLDSMFTMAGPNRAVIAPLLFEGPRALAGEEMHHRSRLMRRYGTVADDPRALSEIGHVRVYRGGTGEIVRAKPGAKLVDFLNERGIECTEVGGLRPDDPLEHEAWREQILAELFGQAANVVATGPGRILAYAENAKTVRTLQEAGVSVRPVAGRQLSQLHGGPHCLTMPLERAPIA
ncbi:MAG: arginine deiminase family protein [Isosphaeraceae bacterium]